MSLDLNKRQWIYLVSGALVALVLCSSYWAGLENLFIRWSTQSEYSHGFLIPLVSAYLIWERRADIHPSFNALGFGICFLALILLFIGEVSALYIVIHYSFVLMLFGVAVTFFYRSMKSLFVPIALLIFSIPLPYVIEVVLTAKMQLISSEFGVYIIRLFNIPVYLSGNVIDLGSYKLHVVEACSGMRYLFPLASIGFIAAYFYRGYTWQKAIVFLSTIPITIFMNSLRIAVTGVLVESYGSSVAEGFLHDFEGWVIFVICMVILLLEIILLERLTQKRPLLEVFRPEMIGANSLTPKYPTTIAVVLFAGCILVAGISLRYIDQREDVRVPVKNLVGFPLYIENWRGKASQLEDDVLAELQLTDYHIANYIENNLNTPINLYIAYYDSQRKGVSPHSPKVCMPGGGWEIAEFDRRKVAGIPVNRSVIRKGMQTQLVYYWFVERGTVVANEYMKKWLLFRDAVLENRTDGALVRVVLPVDAKEEMAQVDQRLESFVEHAQPIIMDYLPGTSYE